VTVRAVEWALETAEERVEELAVPTEARLAKV
jgi:hypothetical protein